MYGEDINGVGKPPLIDRERKMVTLSEYAEAARQGNCYAGANQAGVVWTDGISQTYTGLVVYNPIGSGKILRILAAGQSEIVAPGGANITEYWLGCGYHASTACTAGSELTAYNCRVGGSVGVGVAYDGSELNAIPTWTFPIMTSKTAAVLAVAAAPGLVRIDGLVALPPGAYAAILTFMVGAASGGKGAILWQELDA
jgi:hypothetical protein